MNNIHEFVTQIFSDGSRKNYQKKKQFRYKVKQKIIRFIFAENNIT